MNCITSIATIGDKSMPPRGGIILRNGAMMGLTMLSRVLHGCSYQRIFGNQLNRHQSRITISTTWMNPKMMELGDIICVPLLRTYVGDCNTGWESPQNKKPVEPALDDPGHVLHLWDILTKAYGPFRSGNVCRKKTPPSQDPRYWVARHKRLQRTFDKGHELFTFQACHSIDSSFNGFFTTSSIPRCPEFNSAQRPAS